MPSTASASCRARRPPTGSSRIEDVECIAACTEAPCLQVELPLLPPDQHRRVRRAGRRPPRRPRRRRHPAPRHARPGPPAHPRRSPCRRGDARGRPDAGVDVGPRGGTALMTVTDAPKIITSRLGFDDSHTLARYEATGGYRALRKALGMSPAAVHDEVKTASLLGRGGAGFPAGREVGPHPGRRLAPLPRRQRRRERTGHLQGPHPHGARSPPAHRGRAARLLRRRLRSGVPLRPRRDGRRPGTHRRRPQRGLRRRLRGPQHPRFGLLGRRGAHLGRRCLHRG